MSNNLPVQGFDPIIESKTNLVSVVFGHSTSANYALAVSIAETADKYHRIDISAKKAIHMTVFKKSQMGASKATALLKLVRDWNSTQIFAGGLYISEGYTAFDTIDCYSKSCACNRWESHCHRTIKLYPQPEQDNEKDISLDGAINIMDVFAISEKVQKLKKHEELWLFPCQRLSWQFDNRQIHIHNPSDTVQAAAVRAGCHFCPRFNAKDFKRIK